MKSIIIWHTKVQKNMSRIRKKIKKRQTTKCQAVIHVRSATKCTGTNVGCRDIHATTVVRTLTFRALFVQRSLDYSKIWNCILDVNIWICTNLTPKCICVCDSFACTNCCLMIYKKINVLQFKSCFLQSPEISCVVQGCSGLTSQAD